MSITDDLEPILRRVSGFARFAYSIERHLLEDQADAVAPGAQDTSSSGSTGTGGHSDPTSSKATAIAPYTAKARELRAAVNGVSKAMDEAERIMSRLITAAPGTLPGVDEQLCPGWRVELQERLGGCGKRLARHRRADLRSDRGQGRAELRL